MHPVALVDSSTAGSAVLQLLTRAPAAAAAAAVAAAAVVFFGRQKMEESTKWMGAFWLSIAGAQEARRTHVLLGAHVHVVRWYAYAVLYTRLACASNE
jgi:hypothetical protein